MRSYRLISSPDSIASAKVRLYLRWKNVPFRETVATRQVIKCEVTPRIKGVDVPIFITPTNETHQDSRAIIDFVEARERGDALVPERGELTFAARLMEAYCDDWLANAITQIVWSHDKTRAPLTLAKTLYPDQSPEQNERIARILVSRVGSRLARRGFEASMISDTREQVSIFLSCLDRHLERSDFLLGDRPCIADFGLAAALTTLRDSSADGATFVAERPHVFNWLAEVNGPGSPALGEYRRAYGLPATLIDLLRIASVHFIPHGLEACDAVADWADANPGKINLPKIVGHSRRGDAASELNPQSQFLMQRILDALDQADTPADKTALQETLEKVGCADLADYQPRRTVRHEHFRMRVNLTPNPAASTPNIAFHNIAEPLLQVRRESSETRDLERLVVS